ncbi:MAG: hypothetical protein ABC612_02645 [Candidatus Methanosuratincola petrocarbonis]
MMVSADDRAKKSNPSKVDLWGKLMGCAKSYDPDEAEVELDRGEVE